MSAIRLDLLSETVARPAQGTPLLVGVSPFLRRAIEADLGHGCPSVGYHDLCGDVLTGYAPRLVIAPMIGAGYDCVELARRLSDLGYRGALRALGPVLPMPHLVLAEVAEVTQGEIDFDLMPLPVTGPRRLN